MPKQTKKNMSPEDTLAAENKQVYNRDADEFAKQAPDLIWWKYIGEPAYDKHLQEHYNERTIHLDLGTASARVPQYLIDNGVNPENITGVELSPDQVKIARQRVPEAEFIVGDISKIQLPPEKFTLATSNMVYEFLTDNELDDSFTNTFDALESGGTFFFITTHPDKMKRDSGLTKPGKFITRFPWGTEGPNYYRTTENFIDAVEKAGFEINVVEELSIPPEAKDYDPQEYQRYASYPKVRLVIKATKP